MSISFVVSPKFSNIHFLPSSLQTAGLPLADGNCSLATSCDVFVFAALFEDGPHNPFG